MGVEKVTFGDEEYRESPSPQPSTLDSKRGRTDPELTMQNTITSDRYHVLP